MEATGAGGEESAHQLTNIEPLRAHRHHQQGGESCERLAGSSFHGHHPWDRLHIRVRHVSPSLHCFRMPAYRFTGFQARSRQLTFPANRDLYYREIEGKVYTAYVKEKEEAQREYNTAVNRGQAAAHVQQR